MEQTNVVGIKHYIAEYTYIKRNEEQLYVFYTLNRLLYCTVYIAHCKQTWKKVQLYDQQLCKFI